MEQLKLPTKRSKRYLLQPFCFKTSWTVTPVWSNAITLHFAGADLENSERGSRISPPPPPGEWKLHFSGHAAYSIVDVLLMQSKVTLTFRKIEREHFIKQFSKRNRKTFWKYKNKRGAADPSAPSLNLPMFCLTTTAPALAVFGRSWVQFLSGTQIFFVLRSSHVDQFTFHISNVDNENQGSSLLL